MPFTAAVTIKGLDPLCYCLKCFVGYSWEWWINIMFFPIIGKTQLFEKVAPPKNQTTDNKMLVHTFTY